MAFTPMRFDKDWTKPEDFPTHEIHEAQVRADIQYLFNSIRDQYNSFLANELSAERLPFTPIPGDLQDTTVQEAIEDLAAQVRALVLPELVLPDYSITDIKLHEDAVITEKIKDLAVTTAKLADESVTPEKLAPNAFTGAIFEDGSIPVGKLDINSVDTDNIINNKITYDKLAPDSVYGNRIKDLGIGTTKLVDGAVTTAKLGANAVTAAKIKDGEVKTAKIAAGAVTLAKMAADSVDTSQLVNGSVTEAKLHTDLASKINGKQKQHTTLECTLASGNTTWTITGLTGITATNDIQATFKADPDHDEYFEQWGNCGVRVVSQGVGTLTFKARSATTADIVVSIMIWD